MDGVCWNVALLAHRINLNIGVNGGKRTGIFVAFFPVIEDVRWKVAGPEIAATADVSETRAFSLIVKGVTFVTGSSNRSLLVQCTTESLIEAIENPLAWEAILTNETGRPAPLALRTDEEGKADNAKVDEEHDRWGLD